VDARLVLMGRVVGVHGIRGWIKVESFAEPLAALVDYRPWRLRRGDDQSIVEVAEAQASTRPLRVRLQDVDSREAAFALVGSEILILRDALPEISGQGYYWADLEGMRVVTTEGTDLGTVAHLFATGANDVLVVRGERERLIPFTPGHTVVKVDGDARMIEVDWDADF